MKAKMKTFNNLLRVILLILLLTGWNKDLIQWVGKQDCVKRCGVALLIDGVKYRIVKYFN